MVPVTSHFLACDVLYFLTFDIITVEIVVIGIVRCRFSFSRFFNVITVEIVVTGCRKNTD